MAGKLEKSAFKEVFLARTAAAREQRYSQVQIARLLKIGQDQYKQYETRTPLPHYLVEPFCLACGITADELFRHDSIRSVQPRPPRARRRKAA